MILHIVCLYGKCNHRIFLLYYFSEFFFKIDIIIGFDRFLTPFLPNYYPVLLQKSVTFAMLSIELL